MAYLDAARGYIADVPEIVFYRCDQKVFHFNELTSFNFETKNDPIVIRCGHSRHPVAFIDALKEMNIEFESAGITSDLFAMSASKVTQKAEFSSLESKRYTVNQDNQIILPFLVQDKSVSIYKLYTTGGAVYCAAPPIFLKSDRSIIYDGNSSMIVSMAYAVVPTGAILTLFN